MAPGDRVVVLPGTGGGVVERVLPRRSRFSRDSTTGGKPQVIAANVDLVVALLPVAQPEPNPRLADRILAAAAAEGVPGAVAVSKVDLDPGALADDFEALYRAAGYPVVRVAVPRGVGLAEMADLLRGRTSVLVGPSGAGKTTLLRALLGPGVEGLATGEVNPVTGKGRHTTTAGRLLSFPGGGWVVDTAGVRSLALRDLEAADVPALFPEFAAQGRCRFQDCSHVVEPGCAVRAAVEAGRVDRRRHESYAALLATVREEAARRASGRARR